MMETAIGENAPGLKFDMTSPGLAKSSQGPAFELKFKLTLAEAEFVEAWARAHLLPDCHGADGFYQVTSVYCDTPRFDVFHRNPRTGAEVAIPPGKAVRFKPGKELQSLQ